MTSNGEWGHSVKPKEWSGWVEDHEHVELPYESDDEAPDGQESQYH